MSNIVSALKPEKVFKYFQEISLIPRCSGDEKRVSDYLVNFAKKRNLEVIQEDCLNVIIKKPATKGYENSKTVILQGHMDMVCVKGENSNHNFDTDPIQLIVDGDFLKAFDTTLGADNGIAIAMGLAILDSEDLEHPELEVFLTVSEETGMDGASLLDPENLKGEILINMDSEEEGVLLSSCAGGVDSIIKLPIEWTNIEPENHVGYKISIKGLLGGHSGIEINKNRANAIKLMGRVLRSIQEQNISIASINGGEKTSENSKIDSKWSSNHECWD
jgi:dipeptidase D